MQFQDGPTTLIIGYRHFRSNGHHKNHFSLAPSVTHLSIRSCHAVKLNMIRASRLASVSLEGIKQLHLSSMAQVLEEDGHATSRDGEKLEFTVRGSEFDDALITDTFCGRGIFRTIDIVNSSVK